MNKLKSMFGGGSKDKVSSSSSSVNTARMSSASSVSSNKSGASIPVAPKVDGKQALEAKYTLGKKLGSGTYGG